MSEFSHRTLETLLWALLADEFDVVVDLAEFLKCPLRARFINRSFSKVRRDQCLHITERVIHVVVEYDDIVPVACTR